MEAPNKLRLSLCSKTKKASGKKEEKSVVGNKVTENDGQGRVSGQRSHLLRWVPIWLHPGVTDQDSQRPIKCGSVSREMIQNG